MSEPTQHPSDERTMRAAADEPSNGGQFSSGTYGRVRSVRGSLLAGGFVVFSLAAVACGSGSVEFSIGGETPSDAGEDLIEGDLADLLGLEFDDASCDDVEDAEVGSEFSCTATTAEGESVEFDAVIDREDHINVATVNVVTAEALPQLETQASEELGPDVTVDCGGATSVVLDRNSELDCVASNSAGEADAILKVTDTSTGAATIRLADGESLPAAESVNDEINVEDSDEDSAASGDSADSDADEPDNTDDELSIGGLRVHDAAETLIQGDLAEQLGLELDASCDEVDDAAIGSEFSCTATTADGEVVELHAVVDREDHINVSTVNLVTAEVVPIFEQKAAEALSAEAGVPLTLDCGGAQAVVLDENSEIDCVASDGTTEQDAKLTVTDTSTGEFRIRLV